MKKLLSISLLLATSSAFSVEIRPFFNGYGPSESSITTQDNDVKSEKNWDSEYQFAAGTEVNFNAEFSPFRYGFGVGYKNPLKENDTKIIPASIPVWGNFYFGRINTDHIFSPYIVARIGVLPLLTGKGSWWERPFNFFATGGLGVVLPFRIGFEVNYDYASVLKSFEYKDTKFRISTGKLGVRLSFGFEIARDKVYNPHNRIELINNETESSEMYNDDDEEFFTKSTAQPSSAPVKKDEFGTTPTDSIVPVDTIEPTAVKTAPNTTEEPKIEEPVKQKEMTSSEKRRDNLRKKAAKAKSSTKKKTKKKSKIKSTKKHSM